MQDKTILGHLGKVAVACEKALSITRDPRGQRAAPLALDELEDFLGVLILANRFLCNVDISNNFKDNPELKHVCYKLMLVTNEFVASSRHSLSASINSAIKLRERVEDYNNVVIDITRKSDV